MLTENELRQNVAANLTHLLGERDLTQSDLARLIRESNEDLQAARMRAHRYVHAISAPETSRLANLCEVLGVTVDWMIAKHPKKKSRHAG